MVKFSLECKCPADLKTGKDGFAHITPLHCLTTKKEIKAERKRRQNEQTKSVSAMRQRTTNL